MFDVAAWITDTWLSLERRFSGSAQLSSIAVFTPNDFSCADWLCGADWEMDLSANPANLNPSILIKDLFVFGFWLLCVKNEYVLHWWQFPSLLKCFVVLSPSVLLNWQEFVALRNVVFLQTFSTDCHRLGTNKLKVCGKSFLKVGLVFSREEWMFFWRSGGPETDVNRHCMRVVLLGCNYRNKLDLSYTCWYVREERMVNIIHFLSDMMSARGKLCADTEN